jgi:hypothetical protein
MALVTGQQLADNLDIEYAAPQDDILNVHADSACVLIGYLVTPASFAAEPAPLQIAAMTVATETYQAAYAAGGESISVDFTPGPRINSAIMARVTVLMAPYKQMTTMVG